MSRSARLAIDIGGTFTDVALEMDWECRQTAKVLTTPGAPERGVIDAIEKVMTGSDVSPADVRLVIHGTTLATNALIQRKGAKTALVVTEGHRDALEMAYENRFEQYDINIDRPEPLVPRHLRLPVRERVDSDGNVLIPLDEASVRELIPVLEQQQIASVAIGLIHAYANPDHERRVAEILAEAFPKLVITLASAVCPEVREYERLSTACANAYIQPLMARYLHSLQARLTEGGYECPFLFMTSGGGLTTLDTAAEFPIRLVESGPAGGAILASYIALECGLDHVLSVDMGGTTAKLCLIDDGRALHSRNFEVDRTYRFKKGSGLPVRIPVIEMVEIGAGGGSIASVDQLRRIQVGPQSAGSEPGPAAYGRGGTDPTVTDADITLGRIDPSRFAGGSIPLEPTRAAAAIADGVGTPLGVGETVAALGISEVVDENMANAARTHAIEWGKSTSGRSMVAFGGSAPLHAARLAEKLQLDQVVVPTDAGVGSAIGFLLAPIAYEVVRSRYMRLSKFNASLVNAVMEEMRAEAYTVVRQGAPTAEVVETGQAFMRYIGQGHEIAVNVPLQQVTTGDADSFEDAFDSAYALLYGRTIPGLDVEVLSWTLVVTTVPKTPEPIGPPPNALPAPPPTDVRPLIDSARGDLVDAALHTRESLEPGMTIDGPALIMEDQTTTVVPSRFSATINERGYIVMTRK